jgi:hypothetical protein
LRGTKKRIGRLRTIYVVQLAAGFETPDHAFLPEMALRIEKVFGVKMDTLLKMQARYDTWQMRQREGEIKLKPYEPA